MQGYMNDCKAFKRRPSEEHMNEVKGKTLHGQFLRETEGVVSDKCWRWLQKSHLKKSTEALIMAAQCQSLRTNVIKVRIDGTQEDASCRMCRSKDETVNHLLSECPKRAQVEYNCRHDNVAKGINWHLCKQYGIDASNKRYEHNPEAISKNLQVKILWDFTIQMD